VLATILILVLKCRELMYISMMKNCLACNIKGPKEHIEGLGLRCLTPLSTIFQLLSLVYLGGQFDWWR
jgi:hypothetical protein